MVLSTVPHQLGTPISARDAAQERSSDNLLVVSWGGGFMVVDGGVDVLQGERSSGRTVSPSSWGVCRTASGFGGNSSCGLSLGCERTDGMNLGSTVLGRVLPQ